MICIISNDAGGAEIISSWVTRQKQKFLFVLDGPAVAIFKRKLGKIFISDLESSIKISKKVICGTSLKSNIEKNGVFYSKKNGIKVISVLDNWINYRDRFIFKKKLQLPDEIWVADEYARKLATKEFKGTKIVKKKNFYLEDLKIELVKMEKQYKKNKKNKNILFVSEPISKDNIYNYNIEDAFNFFMENINLINLELHNITIRPHPSEPVDKWIWAKKYKQVKIISKKNSLIKQIFESDIVVGCETMAMVVAVKAIRRVISIIPPGGKKCALPHNKIEHLNIILK